MKKESIIRAFAQLGKVMRAAGEGMPWTGYDLGITEEEYNKLNNLIIRQRALNGWFTEDNVRKSMLSIGEWLTEEDLKAWTEPYSFTEAPKKIAVIMAGNIPLVGFHDFLSVLITGNHVVAKLSSEDNTLLPELAHILKSFDPELEDRILFSSGKIGDVEAVIATGSDNSLRYFEQYFGKYPHIFRKNRTSVAVLDGTETELELETLGKDIFEYYGLGCRNVTHLIIKKGFDLDRIFKGIYSFGEVINHHKYANNYDYYKAVFLMNKHELLDNNFVLFRETKELFSPLAMVHYHYYEDAEEVNDFIREHENEIQVVVGHGHVPFGQAQCPLLNDYADNVDTLAWLATV